jgi:hypothetical protein
MITTRSRPLAYLTTTGEADIEPTNRPYTYLAEALG